jgi:SAM-dependent methyltransferase
MPLVRSLRKLLGRADEWLARLDMQQVADQVPPPDRFDEIAAFVRSMDCASEGDRQYLEIHVPRIARSLTLVPPPKSSGRVLEMGAYMQMTPVLQCVLGYKEVRGAYFGKLGRVDEKSVKVGGKEVFRCKVDLFDAEKDVYPYPDGHFETVLACEIFEHMLHDPMHMLLEMHRVLEEGGALLLTTPNVASYFAVAQVIQQSGNPQMYSKYTDPRGEYAHLEIPHVREYTPLELQQALEAAGFEIENLSTELIYTHGPLWVRDFLERNKFPTSHRGEQIFCLARKRSGRTIDRYPKFLYDV